MLQDNRTDKLTEPYILVKCETQNFFSVDFLATVMIFLFSGVGLFTLLSVLYVIRKKYVERRRATEDARKKMECVSAIMPSKKYSSLVEEN